jgi:Mg/Co/Ni transporter MgtE
MRRRTFASARPFTASHRLVQRSPAISAALVTTLVDATGLVIYLTIAKSILTALQV